MNKEMGKKYEEIKKSVEQLRQQLAEMASDASDDLQEVGEGIMQEVAPRVGKVIDAAKQKTKEVDEFVSENPWATIAVVSLAALALGYVVSQAKVKQK